MNMPQHVLDQDIKTCQQSTFKTYKEESSPSDVYDVRYARNAGDTYKSNKLNVEWTEVEETAGCLQVAADYREQQIFNIKHGTCIAKVIENVDPATFCSTIDGQAAIPQTTVMHGHSATCAE